MASPGVRLVLVLAPASVVVNVASTFTRVPLAPLLVLDGLLFASVIYALDPTVDLFRGGSPPLMRAVPAAYGALTFWAWDLALLPSTVAVVAGSIAWSGVLAVRFGHYQRAGMLRPTWERRLAKGQGEAAERVADHPDSFQLAGGATLPFSVAIAAVAIGWRSAGDYSGVAAIISLLVLAATLVASGWKDRRWPDEVARNTMDGVRVSLRATNRPYLFPLVTLGVLSLGASIVWLVRTAIYWEGVASNLDLFGPALATEYLLFHPVAMVYAIVVLNWAHVRILMDRLAGQPMRHGPLLWVPLVLSGLIFFLAGWQRWRIEATLGDLPSTLYAPVYDNVLGPAASAYWAWWEEAGGPIPAWGLEGMVMFLVSILGGLLLWIGRRRPLSADAAAGKRWIFSLILVYVVVFVQATSWGSDQVRFFLDFAMIGGAAAVFASYGTLRLLALPQTRPETMAVVITSVAVLVYAAILRDILVAGVGGVGLLLLASGKAGLWKRDHTGLPDDHSGGEITSARRDSGEVVAKSESGVRRS